MKEIKSPNETNVQFYRTNKNVTDKKDKKKSRYKVCIKLFFYI